jgi:hypothetical protein
MTINTTYNIGDTVAFMSGDDIIEGTIDYLLVDPGGPRYGIEDAYEVSINEVYASKVEAATDFLQKNGIGVEIEANLKSLQEN